MYKKAHGKIAVSQYRKVGALGFEPRSAGFLNAGSDPAGIHGSALQLVITGQQTRSQSFPITGAREDTVLPHTPIRSVLYLAHLLLPLAAPHFLLAPLPSLLASLLPSA